jgi:pimeloyl-ACP methyl ester carboxylesterase
LERSLKTASVLLPLVVTAVCIWPQTATADALRVGWQQVDGIDLFYREGGRPDAPTVVFLHGNPASSLQYKDVMEALADSYHVVAPDYPSFGFSSAPDRASYRYTFDNVAATVSKFLAAKNIKRHSLFMQDYGVPIGFRLISSNPGAIDALIVQNGVIHLDGFPAAQDPNGELRQHWRKRNADVDRRRRAFTAGMRFPQAEGWDASWNQDLILLNMTSA